VRRPPIPISGTERPFAALQRFRLLYEWLLPWRRTRPHGRLPGRSQRLWQAHVRLGCHNVRPATRVGGGFVMPIILTSIDRYGSLMVAEYTPRPGEKDHWEL
jgi:hypothetical protein